MPDTLTITGTVATTPRRITTSAGLDIALFRLASTHRRYDQDAQRWIDGETNWYTVNAFRRLAINLFTSIAKGDRVIVTGTLRIRSWDTDDSRGTAIELDADAIGHDLTWGTSTWTRTRSTAAADETPEQTPEATPPATEPAQA